jgi:hypothetical protein
MMFSVPQFIDVEDKIAGPLTWKQLGWMIGMGAVVLAIFAIFDTSLAIVFTVPTVLLFCALAFYKPDGFTMISFMSNSFLFFFPAQDSGLGTASSHLVYFFSNEC